MWHVYLLRLNDNSLYTGITKDIKNRLKDHRAGNGSKYVRSRLPLKLVYKEEKETKSLALKREIEIKRWSKSKKEELVSNYKKS
ncbi:MAG: GIY-YIG nuclease family protein [Candidatus Woesearchaeota archaeon]